MAVLELFAAAPAALTGDRVVASAAAVVALAGVIIGGVAVARAAAHPSTTISAVTLVAGLTGTVVGAWVVASADGGPGTGNGIVGGYAALLLGPVAVLLAGLALARARRRGA